ncbi:hypothetical protein DR999_PMT21968 [Platysternon megacephalum]|uniref:Uncharacterized protein n=1 Tax=Platysternon megacephalum TaxID=55544 RepID=A0A4D9DJA8_9SAUR|nr:hypothetical protein DR999_PMT21968 [Platysternon megacephalum]
MDKCIKVQAPMVLKEEPQICKYNIEIPQRGRLPDQGGGTGRGGEGNLTSPLKKNSPKNEEKNSLLLADDELELHRYVHTENYWKDWRFPKIKGNQEFQESSFVLEKVSIVLTK